jgi:predicted ATP-grasp superfamily ATP-dependent carboligase
LIVDRATVWPVEINPRYSASVEVLEETLGLNMIAEHARLFGVEPRQTKVNGCGGSVAKLILFARRPARAPEDLPWTDPGVTWPMVADLPAAGTILSPGDPVLTVFGRGATTRESLSNLRVNAAAWQRRIDGWRAP